MLLHGRAEERPGLVILSFSNAVSWVGGAVICRSGRAVTVATKFGKFALPMGIIMKHETQIIVPCVHKRLDIDGRVASLGLVSVC